MEGEVEEKAIFSRSAAPAITTSSFLLPLEDRAKGAKGDHVDYYGSGIALESKHRTNLPDIIISGGKVSVHSNITTFSMSRFKPLTTIQVLLQLVLTINSISCLKKSCLRQLTKTAD